MAPRRADDKESYQGRRRWPEPTRRRLRVGGAVVLCLMVLAGLALRWPEGFTEDAGRASDPMVPGRSAAPGPSVITESPQPEPSQAAPRPMPAPSRSASTTAEQLPQAATVFTPIQIEAEDARNSVTGAAQRVSYGTASGGVLVRDIGSPPGGSSGSLTIPVSVADAGQYNVLVRVAVPDGLATLTLVVTASGSVPVAVQVTGRSLCCSNGSLSLGLQSGANWITFGNPTDRGPAIDFIQITRSAK